MLTNNHEGITTWVSIWFLNDLITEFGGLC